MTKTADFAVHRYVRDAQRTRPATLFDPLAEDSSDALLERVCPWDETRLPGTSTTDASADENTRDAKADAQALYELVRRHAEQVTKAVANDARAIVQTGDDDDPEAVLAAADLAESAFVLYLRAWTAVLLLGVPMHVPHEARNVYERHKSLDSGTPFACFLAALDSPDLLDVGDGMPCWASRGVMAGILSFMRGRQHTEWPGLAMAATRIGADEHEEDNEWDEKVDERLAKKARRLELQEKRRKAAAEAEGTGDAEAPIVVDDDDDADDVDEAFAELDEDEEEDEAAPTEVRTISYRLPNGNLVRSRVRIPAGRRVLYMRRRINAQGNPERTLVISKSSDDEDDRAHESSSEEDKNEKKRKRPRGARFDDRPIGQSALNARSLRTHEPGSIATRLVHASDTITALPMDHARGLVASLHAMLALPAWRAIVDVALADPQFVSDMPVFMTPPFATARSMILRAMQVACVTSIFPNLDVRHLWPPELAKARMHKAKSPVANFLESLRAVGNFAWPLREGRPGLQCLADIVMNALFTTAAELARPMQPRLRAVGMTVAFAWPLNAPLATTPERKLIDILEKPKTYFHVKQLLVAKMASDNWQHVPDVSDIRLFVRGAEAGDGEPVVFPENHTEWLPVLGQILS